MCQTEIQGDPSALLLHFDALDLVVQMYVILQWNVGPAKLTRMGNTRPTIRRLCGGAWTHPSFWASWASCWWECGWGARPDLRGLLQLRVHLGLSDRCPRICVSQRRRVVPNFKRILSINNYEQKSNITHVPHKTNVRLRDSYFTGVQFYTLVSILHTLY